MAKGLFVIQNSTVLCKRSRASLSAVFINQGRPVTGHNGIVEDIKEG